MSMLKQALSLWKNERNKKGTTLQRRLILFFICVTVSLVLAFSLLLMIFGITGKEERALHNFFDTELANIADNISDDFGSLSVDGINLAESMSAHANNFFDENDISAGDFLSRPELIEPMLSEQAHLLISMVNGRSCGGAFVLLDTTINPEGDNAEFARSGIFIKKTQPTSTQAVGVKMYYLRGPAQIARENNIELLGQWKMEYDTADQHFFADVLEQARQNPDLPLSRLYYWTGRVTLKDNSEAGFLLCVPLRSKDGTVFGLCGIEVSDRMFKSLYSPASDKYENAFAIAAPKGDDCIKTSSGIIAGNYYLTGNRMYEDLKYGEGISSFESFASSDINYGGKNVGIRLYPSDSPYETDRWEVAVLMHEKALQDAVSGNDKYLIVIIAILLLLSILSSVVISHHYLKPVTTAFESVRTNGYSDMDTMPYLEINDLFDFLAQRDREREEEFKQLESRHNDTKEEMAKARTRLSHLIDKKKKEVDPESYRLFLTSLKTLTKKEREVFELYMEGKSAKDIVDILGITENTLKFHNKNLYGKLGVNSRKELLLYAQIMREENKL